MSDYSVTQAHAMWSAGELVIIDVREGDEHEATRVEGVPLIPLSELRGRIDEIPTDVPVAVLCGSGARSGRVADYRTAAGEHGEVANIEGGIIAWAVEGLPYEGEPPR